LLSGEEAAESLRQYGREALKEELRRAIAEGETAADAILERARIALARRFSPSLRPAINATGVLLHTNLGRAPLGAPARDAISSVSRRYSTLEYEPSSGARGHRQDHIRSAARSLFGCADAIALNNNASAVFLALSALARGRRVLVSRGELVAIGGSFKIPEILEASGALLSEVGTTNRTTIKDYRRALTPEVGLLLTVHPSNYEIRGFTEHPEPREIAKVAREAQIPWLHDQGTGCVEPLDEFGVTGEATVASCLADGADLVTFSADKLFGGPQAGFLIGRADLVGRASQHPVARVVRPDKLTLAALSATLAVWKTGHWRELPVYRAASQPLSLLESRGHSICETVGGAKGVLQIDVGASEALFGGGTSPEKRFPSRALHVTHPEVNASGLARALRESDIPIVGRVEEGRLWLDLRSIDPEEDSAVARALSELSVMRQSGQ
jgi:L-seryl-tRNA(Ser) seleniumtransferase